MESSTLKSVFRFFGFLEGGSLLLLLGIAIPLKYLAGKPEVVTIIGSIHGFFNNDSDEMAPEVVGHRSYCGIYTIWYICI